MYSFFFFMNFCYFVCAKENIYYKNAIYDFIRDLSVRYNCLKKFFMMPST